MDKSEAAHIKVVRDGNTVNITVDTAKPCKVELVGLADTIDIAGSMTYTVTL